MATMTTSTAEIPEFAMKLRERLGVARGRYQQRPIDAARSWTRSVSHGSTATAENGSAFEIVAPFASGVTSEVSRSQRHIAVGLTAASVTDTTAS